MAATMGRTFYRFVLIIISEHVYLMKLICENSARIAVFFHMSMVLSGR